MQAIKSMVAVNARLVMGGLFLGINLLKTLAATQTCRCVAEPLDV
jgi:hypothetical protein